MVIAILAGTAMYVAVLLATAAMAPWQELVAEGSPWLTGATVRRSLGTVGLAILGTSVGAAIFTGINGFYLASEPADVLHGAREAPAARVREASPRARHAAHHHRLRRRRRRCSRRGSAGKRLLWVVDMSALGTAFGYAYTCLAAYSA